MKNDHITELESLLTLCDYSKPVDAATKHTFARNKNSVYVRILKTLGLYSIFTAISLSYFFFLKKIAALTGFKIFVTTCVIASVASAGIATYHYSHTAKTAVSAEPATVMEQPAVIATKPAVSNQPITQIKCAVGVTRFKTTSANPAVTAMAGKYFLDSLNALKGAGFAAPMEIGAGKNLSYVIYPTIEKFDNSFHLMIKVIDKKTSTILFVTKATAQSEEKLKETCQSIAEQIADKL